MTPTDHKPMHPAEWVGLAVIIAWVAALGGAFGEAGESIAVAAFFVAVAIAATIRGSGL